MPVDDVRQTFVLIPGAWCGAWSWHPVARLLVQRGHRVLALTLPGLEYGSSTQELALGDAGQFIVDEVERRQLRDVTLVSHSWGAFPASAAAHDLSDRISRLVYYNAAVPQPGISMADENAQYGEVFRQAIANSPDGTIPADVVAPLLMPDEEPSLARIVGEMLVPQPGRYITDPFNGPDPRTLKPTATYILGDTDTVLARPGAEFAARANADIIKIPGGHMTLVTTPATVADALLAS